MDELFMVNHLSKKQTTIIFENYNFGVELKDSEFSQNGLIRSGS